MITIVLNTHIDTCFPLLITRISTGEVMPVTAAVICSLKKIYIIHSQMYGNLWPILYVSCIVINFVLPKFFNRQRQVRIF